MVDARPARREGLLAGRGLLRAGGGVAFEGAAGGLVDAGGEVDSRPPDPGPQEPVEVFLPALQQLRLMRSATCASSRRYYRAQADFFEVTVEVAGERQPAWLFVLHLMYSGRDYAWLYERCNQVAFLDGHVRAFEHFGGVVRRCRAVSSAQERQPALTRRSRNAAARPFFRIASAIGPSRAGPENSRSSTIRWISLLSILAMNLKTLGTALARDFEAGTSIP